MKLKMTDWQLALRVGRCADQICRAVEDVVPERRFRGWAWVSLYDLRGYVGEIPRLAIACSTSIGFYSALAVQPVQATFSHIVFFPNLIFERINRAFIQSQTLLHHELTHILLEHDISKANPTKGASAYFNHPYETDAFFHQGLATLARTGGQEFWNKDDAEKLLGENQDAFIQRLHFALVPQFRKALSPANQSLMADRAAQFWEEGRDAIKRIGGKEGPRCGF